MTSSALEELTKCLFEIIKWVTVPFPFPSPSTGSLPTQGSDPKAERLARRRAESPKRLFKAELFWDLGFPSGSK